MSNRFLAIILGLIIVFGGIVLVNRDNDESASVSAEPSSHIYGAVEQVTPDGAAEPVTQVKEGAVELIEYGDFQCPACAAYHPLLQQLKEQYKDQLAFQFRHYPLVAIHPNAMAAHKAAEAAGMQDKFWEMHDLIYQQQQSWKDSSNPNQTFAGYAEQLNLDMEKYNADVASAEVNAIIQADLQAGRDRDVTGTPAFILDGQLIENPSSVEAFEQLIEEAIEEKSSN